MARRENEDMPDYITLLNLDWPADAQQHAEASASRSSSASPAAHAGAAGSSSAVRPSASAHFAAQQHANQQQIGASHAAAMMRTTSSSSQFVPSMQTAQTAPLFGANEPASSAFPGIGANSNDLDFWLNANFDFDEDGFNRDLGIAASKYNTEVDLASIVGAGSSAGPHSSSSGSNSLALPAAPSADPLVAAAATSPTAQNQSSLTELSALLQHQQQAHLSVISALSSNPIALQHYLASVGQTASSAPAPLAHVPPVAAAAAAALSQAALPALIAASMRHNQPHTQHAQHALHRPPASHTAHLDPSMIAQRILLQDASMSISSSAQHQAALAAISHRSASVSMSQSPMLGMTSSKSSVPSLQQVSFDRTHSNTTHASANLSDTTIPSSNTTSSVANSGNRNTTIASSTSGSSSSNGKGKHPAPELTKPESDELDKRRRNTIASARFRAKKKAREQAMEQTAREMTSRVQILEQRLRDQDMEIKWLRQLLMDRDGSTKLQEIYRRNGLELSETGSSSNSASSSGSESHGLTHDGSPTSHADETLPTQDDIMRFARNVADSAMSNAFSAGGPTTSSQSQQLSLSSAQQSSMQSLMHPSQPITAEQLAAAVAYALRASQNPQATNTNQDSSSQNTSKNDSKHK